MTKSGPSLYNTHWTGFTGWQEPMSDRGFSRREFIQASVAGLLAACSDKKTVVNSHKPAPPRTVVLGFDGVDPRLVDRWMQSGDLKNFARLQKQGGYGPLGSTNPPNSPVAWSSFATGLDPGQHGIFGFLKRDPQNYSLGTAACQVTPPSSGPNGYAGPQAFSHRMGKTFWETLDNQGISQTLLFVPYAYPPPQLQHGRVLAGLGVPDLRFTNSSFTFFTTEGAAGGSSKWVAGGRVTPVSVHGKKVKSSLEGTKGPDGKSLQVPLELDLDRGNGRVQIHLGDQTEDIAEGQRSRWFQFRFDAPGGWRLHGRVRFHLLSVRNELRLYASALQLDPKNPALPLGAPQGWLEEAVAVHGGLPTVGWLDDTSAVNAGVLPPEVFLSDLLDTMEGQAELVVREVVEGATRLLVAVFTGTDRGAHMFYRELSQPDGGPLRTVYQAMDRIIGRVLDVLAPQTRLLVLSDHGFHPFERMLHLNTWLESKGWLSRSDPKGTIDFLQGVNWRKTQAYSLDTGQIFINQQGREGQGIVAPGKESQALFDSIREYLLAMRDPHNGQKPIRAVYPISADAAEALKDRAPDLQVAFAPGYRSSWETSLGGAPPGDYLVPNPKPWTGDHAASDMKETPGILLSNTPWKLADPKITDMASTLLHLFGFEEMGTGRSIF